MSCPRNPYLSGRLSTVDLLSRRWMFLKKVFPCCRIRWKGYKIDVFTTHLIAYTQTSGNNYIRYTIYKPGACTI